MMTVPQTLLRGYARLLALTFVCLWGGHAGPAAAERSPDDYRIYALTCSPGGAHALLFVHTEFQQIDPAGIEKDLTEFSIPSIDQGDVTCFRGDRPIDAASAAETAEVEQPLLIAIVPGYVARSVGVPGAQVNSIWDFFMEPRLPPLEVAKDGSVDVKDMPLSPDIVLDSNSVAETWSPIAYLFQTSALTCDQTLGAYQHGTALWVSTQTCSIERQSSADAALRLSAQAIDTANLCWAPNSAEGTQPPVFYCHETLVPALQRQIAQEIATWLKKR